MQKREKRRAGNQPHMIGSAAQSHFHQRENASML